MGMDMGWVRASRSLTRSDKSGGGRHLRTMNGQTEAWKGGMEREKRGDKKQGNETRPHTDATELPFQPWLSLCAMDAQCAMCGRLVAD